MSSSTAKPGRNALCPCGSGRKYKHCCGLRAPAPRPAGQKAADRRSSMLGSSEIIELMSLSQSGRHADFERRARELTQRRPLAGLAWKALTVALRSQGKDSLAVAQRAVQLLPQDAEAHNHLALALLDAGRAAEAAGHLQQSLRLKPEDLGVWMRLGNLLTDMGRLEEAASCYSRAAQLAPNHVEIRYRLGFVSMGLGRYAQAADNFERATALQPANAELHAHLGNALRMLGRTAEAETQFRSAIDLNPDLTDAWVGLAYLRRLTSADSAWLSEVQRLLARPMNSRAAIALHYAVGKYFDDTEDFDRAFSAFERANELVRQQGRHFDAGQVIRDVDRILETFDAGWLADARAQGQASSQPVFIVGMPKSGCSLLGAVLSAHPAVHDAGELRFWSDAASYYDAAIGRGEAPAGLIGRLGAEYVRLIQALSPDAPRVIDHMPGNFARLGIIAAALPGARIIHVRRDPIDTCLALFSQDSSGALAFATRLEELATYYMQYRRLMQHWRSLLPNGMILELDCERLDAEPESCCRELIELLGLPWDDRCLEAQRAARLSPLLQIGPAGHWRHYVRHLGPLLELSEAGRACGEGCSPDKGA